MSLKHISLSTVLISVMLLSGNSIAFDTDVYLTTPNVSRDDSPNVLLIIDNSGSMDTIVPGTRPAYDPTVDYSTLSGNPGIPAGRIYWSTATSPANPPGATSRQWFSTSKNNCEASKTVLGTSGSGVYTSVKIVGYRTSNNRWEELSSGSGSSTTDSRFTYIDCQADNGATDPNGYVKSTGTAYTSNSTQQINWGGLTGNAYLPRLYSSNYMNYWHNSTLPTADKTRLQIAKESLNAIIDANPTMRFGLMVFNYNEDGGSRHGGRVIMKIDTMTDARRTTMKNMINNIPSYGWTPLAETLWEAYSYFGGKAVDFGNNDSSATPTRDLTAESGSNYISPFNYECQQAYVIYMTDGDPTNDDDANSKIGALTGIGTFNSNGSRLDELAGWLHDRDPITGTLLSGNGGRRVITYTIGFGTGISASGLALLQTTASRGGGLYTAAESSEQLTSAFQSALIDIQTKTSSFAAPSLSVNAFNKLFNRDDVYFALFKPSGGVQWDGNVKKFTLCNNTNPSSGCAFGEVLDKNGVAAIDAVTQRIKDNAVSFWSSSADGSTVIAGGAGGQVPAPASRNLYTYRGAYGTPPMDPTKITAAGGNPIFDAAVSAPSILGLTASGSSATDTTNVTDLINWMLGQDSYDQWTVGTNGYERNGDGSTTDRRWAFGDPVHSRPVAITYGGTNAQPIIKLFVGTNDGVIHLINDYNGQEEWAFIPQELLNQQYPLSQDPDGVHIYGIDGTPSFWIRDNNNNGIIEPENVSGKQDKIYMFIGMRRGGNNIYAFDVTPTATLTDRTSTTGITPKLLWVIRGGCGNTGTGDADYLKLCQTWSRPQITRIRFGTSSSTDESQGKTVLMFSGGYHTNQDVSIAPAAADPAGNAIFIVDPETGQRLWWASNAGSGATLEVPGMDFAIPSDLALMDSNGDGAVDRVYVGDTGGQMWRVDLSPSLKLNSNGHTSSTTKAFKLADIACPVGTRPLCSGTAAQDRRKFFFPPDVTQVNDTTYEDVTESKYDLVTTVAGDREDPLDLLTVGLPSPIEAVHNRIYAFRDYSINSLAGAATLPAALTESNLYNATSNGLQDPNNTTVYDPALAAIKASKGWFMDLKNASATPQWEGEKGLARTVVFDKTLFVTTFTPSNSNSVATQCSASEGTAKLYSLNMLSGAAVYDYNDDSNVTTSDRVKTLGGGIPSELVTVIREGGTSALVGTSGGTAKPKINSALPRFKTFWYED